MSYKDKQTTMLMSTYIIIQMTSLYRGMLSQHTDNYVVLVYHHTNDHFLAHVHYHTDDCIYVPHISSYK